MTTLNVTPLAAHARRAGRPDREDPRPGRLAAPGSSTAAPAAPRRARLPRRPLRRRRAGAGDSESQNRAHAAYSLAMPDMHAARRDRAQARVAALDADAALITYLPNVRYLTGLASSNAALLVPPPAPACSPRTRGTRWPPQRDCPDLELLTERFLVPAFGALAAGRVVPQAAVRGAGGDRRQPPQARRRSGRADLAPFGRKSRNCARSRMTRSSTCSPPPAGSAARRSRSCCPRSGRGSPNGSWRPRSSAGWSTSARKRPPSTRSWPAARTARYPITRPASGRCSGATWSRSTSARGPAATTRT